MADVKPKSLICDWCRKRRAPHCKYHIQFFIDAVRAMVGLDPICERAYRQKE